MLIGGMKVAAVKMDDIKEFEERIHKRKHLGGMHLGRRHGYKG
jgi:hypothetical protein